PKRPRFRRPAVDHGRRRGRPEAALQGFAAVMANWPDACLEGLPRPAVGGSGTLPDPSNPDVIRPPAAGRIFRLPGLGVMSKDLTWGWRGMIGGMANFANASTRAWRRRLPCCTRPPATTASRPCLK